MAWAASTVGVCINEMMTQAWNSAPRADLKRYQSTSKARATAPQNHMKPLCPIMQQGPAAGL